MELTTQIWRDVCRELYSLYSDEEAAAVWLFSKQERLGNEKPFDLIIDGRGEEVLQLVRQMLEASNAD